MITRRCSERRFFLRPTPEGNNAFIYCLAVAAQKYGVKVIFTATMSNHHHTGIVDVEGGVAQNEEGVAMLRDRLAAMIGDDVDGLPVAEVIERVYSALARAPSHIVLATLDDALAVEERPNLPGAPIDFPNWALALPTHIEDLTVQALPGRIARALTRA
jgi:4-alpha-glucanotransferase